ncbi:hypothetical protein GCM10008927_23830 [Amylibacter ulvae]|uniref:Uncharacterized protein n=1 Tax=Paramylibacter ulvae TaxID=1651968 RepID=A0ABQ3D607_9RHOB|nr:hypothetical protein [Amylibacter ulvae]GHA57394.1 hypothetical protein GCM10008927_23830 [Amylibacter ulvae]
MPAIDIDFDAFKTPTALMPDVFLASGVRFAFNEKSAMKLTAHSQRIDDIETLIIRGENRSVDDWLGLEIDIPDFWQSVDVNFRYAPAERIFPRIYYKTNGRGHAFDEPDRAAPSDYASLRFSRARWCALANITTLENARMSLLMPAREWFVLGLREISGTVDG